MKQLAAAGLQATKNKCKFVAPFVEFQGHLVDEKGICLLSEKV